MFPQSFRTVHVHPLENLLLGRAVCVQADESRQGQQAQDAARPLDPRREGHGASLSCPGHGNHHGHVLADGTCFWLVRAFLSGAPDRVLQYVEAGILEHLRVLLEFEQVFNSADVAVAIHSQRSIERRGLEAGEMQIIMEACLVMRKRVLLTQFLAS